MPAFCFLSIDLVREEHHSDPESEIALVYTGLFTYDLDVLEKVQYPTQRAKTSQVPSINTLAPFQSVIDKLEPVLPAFS